MGGKDNRRVGFALGIYKRTDESSRTIQYHVQSENRGIVEEVILTLVRNWLRQAEKDYYKRFIGNQG